MPIDASNLDVKCSSLSVRAFFGLSKLLTHCFEKIVATVVALVFVFGMVLVKFEKWSVITTIYW